MSGIPNPNQHSIYKVRENIFPEGNSTLTDSHHNEFDTYLSPEFRALSL